MFFEIFIPSVSAIFCCVYFNRKDRDGENPIPERRYPGEKIEVNKIYNNNN